MADDDCENIDIVSIIKFCNQTKQIVFPAQVFFFLEKIGFLMRIGGDNEGILIKIRDGFLHPQ